ncbi:PQQ-binding-like beta-propeller repeat protein [Streptomyces sedi]|nr:PQQ-binding-like beta-propeller repeat protein [Streptomyces sedi]
MAGGLLLAGCTSGGGDGSDGAEERRETGTPPREATMTWLWETEIGDGGPEPTWAWSVDDGPVVFVTEERVVGLDPETGTELWSLEPPPGAESFCQHSAEVNDDGIAAVMYRRGGECRMLAALDARAGEILWEDDFADAHPADDVNPDSRQSPVVVAGDVVSVALYAGIVRFDAGSGALLPALEAPGNPGHVGETSWRHANTYTVAFTGGGEGTMEAAAFDTESGDRLWAGESTILSDPYDTWEVLPGAELALSVGGTVRLLDDAGEERGASPLPNRVFGGVISGSTLVVENVDASTVEAYDLGSGAELWSESMADDGLGWLRSSTGGGPTESGFHEGDPIWDALQRQGAGWARLRVWWDPRTGEALREEIEPGDASRWNGVTLVRDGVLYQVSEDDEWVTALQLSE